MKQIRLPPWISDDVMDVRRVVARWLEHEQNEARKKANGTVATDSPLMYKKAPSYAIRCRLHLLQGLFSLSHDNSNSLGLDLLKGASIVAWMFVHQV